MKLIELTILENAILDNLFFSCEYFDIVGFSTIDAKELSGIYIHVDQEGECKIYYKHGKYHRKDGPAVEYKNGTKEWWVNGKRHREDGPAIEYANGSKCWYFNDVYQKASLCSKNLAGFASS